MLQWPVEPQLGISAYFDDAGYQERFGIPHKAIDIPEDQGSPVRAAADGIVIKVSDRGMGFNALTIQHGGGLSTLYGHVSEFFVEEGQEVYAGEVVARSGGTPKTPGAGLLTTGPHLHFEALLDGEHVDPLEYLIAHPMVGAAGLEGGGGGGEEGWEGGTEEGTTEGAD
jgi:murein DD-endopeptidase MepM/ murein hydrolase activator NlpD